MSETVVYLLRHAEVIPAEDVNNKDWVLSGEGEKQAKMLAKTLSGLNLDVIYSSPYKRALDTVKPLSEKLGIDVISEEEFRETNPDLPYMAPTDFQLIMEKCWRDLDHVEVKDMESLKACQIRMLVAINRIAQQNVGKRILICAHGTPISTVLRGFNPSFGMKDWSQMRMPDMYKLISDGQGGHWDRSFSF